jgi:60S ribosome subunit biogenesis protein NIP7
MPFLYGANIVKTHVGRWSEDCPERQGVVVLSMDDTHLVISKADDRSIVCC